MYTTFSYIILSVYMWIAGLVFAVLQDITDPNAKTKNWLRHLIASLFWPLTMIIED